MYILSFMCLFAFVHIVGWLVDFRQQAEHKKHLDKLIDHNKVLVAQYTIMQKRSSHGKN